MSILTTPLLFSVCIVQAEEEKPLFGGTFVYSGPAEPIILNPILAGDTYSNWILAEVMEPLVEYDEKMNITPELAESWIISPDGKTYTFNLRRGVKWHDGAPFTADDVAYTYNTIKEEKGVAVTHFEPVLEIWAKDTHTVVVELDRSVGGFLDGLVGNWLGTRIVPEHIYNTDEYSVRDNPANFDPIGTGPFKFVEWVKGSHVLMEANEDYWGEGPYIDKLVYNIIPEQSVALMAFEAGEVHYSTNIPTHEIERVNAIEGVTVITLPDPSAGILQMGCYTQSPEPIGDKRVRQALWLSIDNQKFVDEIYYGYADPGSSTIGTSSPYYNPDAGAKWGERPNYDLANQILDEAGYEIGQDGYRFTIEVMTRVGQTDREDICMILKEDWKNIGVKLEIQLTEFTTLADKIKWGTPEPEAGRDFQTITWGSSTGPEPNTNIFPRYFETGARNYYSYNNTEVNELLLEGQVEADPVKRKQIYYDVQKIMMEEDLPLLPLTHGHAQHAWWSEDWKGMPVLPYAFYSGLNTIWWAHGEPSMAQVAETISGIESEIGELTDNLQELSSNLESLSTNLAESISDVSESIDSMSEILGTMQEEPTGLSELSQSISDLKSTLNTLQTLVIATILVAIISLVVPFIRKT